MRNLNRFFLQRNGTYLLNKPRIIAHTLDCTWVPDIKLLALLTLPLTLNVIDCDPYGVDLAIVPRANKNL